MKSNTSLAIFETHKIRRHFDEKKETWYFSVIDIVAVLTEQLDYNRAKTYWTTLKNRLKSEGSEVVTKCDRLKMMAESRTVLDWVFPVQKRLALFFATK